MKCEIDTLLSGYTENVQYLAEGTRELLKQELPEIQEYADTSARLIAFGYSKTYKESICTIILSKKEIKLGFYKGSELPDTEQLLEGSGKVHKYVAIRKESDLKNPALSVLIKEALKAYKVRNNK